MPKELTETEWKEQEALRVARNEVFYEQQGLDQKEKLTPLGNPVGGVGACRRQAQRLQEAKDKLAALEAAFQKKQTGESRDQ